MCLAHHPEINVDRVSSGVPPTVNVDALLSAITGYDTRIARRIRHDEFYDKVMLPADELLEAEFQKEREAEMRPSGSGDGSQFTWTSSKGEKDKSGAASPSEDESESEDDVSSQAKDDEN
jgi:hypothetical protein